MSRVLGVREFAVKEYQLAARRYPMKSITYILEKIRIADLNCKGLGVDSIPKKAILRQLINDIGVSVRGETALDRTHALFHIQFR